MSQKTKFFNDAIAEAKAIRETAFSNAKLAMAESFAPQVKSMLSTQLNEMEEEMGGSEDEMSLDELLNELEGAEINEVEESEETEVEDSEIEDSEIEDETGLEDSEIEDETGLDGDSEVGEISVDELKDIIRDVMTELEGGESEEAFDAEEEIGDDEEISLDEDWGAGSAAGNPKGSNGDGDLDILIKKIAAKTGKGYDAISNFLYGGKGAAPKEMGGFRESAELKEAKNIIEAQSKTLKEVNLLNSKLLYVNKLFKAKNLTESQKVKVINAFDRATTVKETENVFVTLKESLITTPSRPINESRGRASKPAGVATQRPTAILTEEVDFVARMKKLAGIN